MKRERGIRWKESIGNNNNRESILDMWMSIGADILVGVICTLLFVLSMRIMLEDVYKYCTFGAGNIFLMLLIAFIICGVMEVASRFDTKWSGLVQCGVLGAGIIGCIIYLGIGDNAKEILSGLEKIMSFYVEHWNVYYKTSAGGFVGELRYVEEALDFLTVIVFMTFIWIAKIIESNMVMVIPPALIFILELVVGRSPEALGLFLMLAGCLMANSSAWHAPGFKTAPGRRKAITWLNKYISWASVGICTLLVCIIVNFAGSSSAESLIGKSGDFKEWVNELINDITGASIWDIFDGEGIFPNGNKDDTNTERLSNNSPDFDYKEFMSVTLDYKPGFDIYLRGFYGNDYDDGVWEKDIDEFEDACDNAGFDYDEVSQELVALGVSKLLDTLYANDLSELSTGGSVMITYNDSSERRCYVPYFSQIDQEEVYVEGDGRYLKDKGTENVFFYMWSQDGAYQSYLASLSYGYEWEWEAWYEEYVMDEYLDVDLEAPYAGNVASEINRWDKPSDYLSYTENEKRLYLAEQVATWMERNTEYSLYPPELPGDVDPIEYFLKVSKTGYCMHYASASVMILREMGVPTRYASGYLASADSFTKTGMTDSMEDTSSYYKATILDSQAHAWVEIYLDGIGWVPYEVTKGYNNEVVRQEQATKEPDSNEPTSSNEQTSENETTSEEQTTSSDRENQSTSQNATSGDNKQTESGTNAGGTSGDGFGLSGVNVKLILSIMAIAIIIPLVIHGLMKLRANYREKLKQYISKNRTTRAIKLMNRRIYRKLRLRGKALKSDLRDEAYLEILIKTYPDIPEEELERFMDIVKEVTFSSKRASVEDMEFCYRVYNRIVKNC